MPRNEFRGGQRLPGAWLCGSRASGPLKGPALSIERKRDLHYPIERRCGQRYASTKCHRFSQLRVCRSILR